MTKLNTAIITLTLLLSIVSTVYLYSGTSASASQAQPQANSGLPKLGPGVFPGTDPTSWYLTAEGVLAVPGEMPLFPYNHGDVKISFSRFGENINPFAVSAQTYGGSPVNGIGFQYIDANGNAYDPIRDAAVDINNVVDGWKLVVTYDHATLGPRTLWAYALFSDYTAAGSPANGPTPAGDTCGTVADGWILCPHSTNMPNSVNDLPHGGRKTNALVVTAPTPLVLVDNPRRLVVASINTLYDNLLGPTDTSLPVARLTLTFDFNKDTKELIIIKDVKLLLNVKVANPLTTCDTEFSILSNPTSEGFYDARFTNAKSQGEGLACFQLLDTEEIDQGPAIAGFAHFFDWGFGEGQPTVKCLTIPGPGTDAGDPLYHWDESRPNCYYDAMQAIDTPGAHVVKKSFWPVPDWFTVDAKHQFLQFFSTLDGVTTTDQAVAPEVVGTSAQWNFILNTNQPDPKNPGLDARVAWRSVETLVVTDLNDGAVCQQTHTASLTTGTNTLTNFISGSPTTTDTISQSATGCFTGNVIDREANYFDQMVYNPWDLNTAAAKTWSTSVDYFTVPVTTGCTTACRSPPTHTPFLNVPNGPLAGSTVTSTQNSQWNFGTLNNPYWNSYGSFAERVLGVSFTGSSSTTADSGAPDQLTLLTRGSDYIPVTTAGAACVQTAALPYVPANACTKIQIIPDTLTKQFELFKVIYTELNHFPTGTDNTNFPAMNPYAGSWEWIVVGRGAGGGASDAAAAALVVEAERDNQIHSNGVKLSGLDTQDPNNPTLPFILTDFAGNSAVCATNNYMEAYPPNVEGCRARLRDDFSTINPIDGSNILLVGGPGANMATAMANDFMSAIYRPQVSDLYSDGAWDELSSTGIVFAEGLNQCTPTASLAALGVPSQPTGACTFGSGLTPVLNGFGVVTTYMDVDGTVYFVLWGGTAADTFWLANSALEYISQVGLLGLSGTPYPFSSGWAGVNSVIFKIDYTSAHPPSITIFKQLDTISEVFPEQDN